MKSQLVERGRGLEEKREGINFSVSARLNEISLKQATLFSSAFRTELSLLHQHAARDKLVVGTGRLPGWEPGSPSFPCLWQVSPVASP